MRYFLLIFFITCVATVGILGFRDSHTRRPPIELFPDMVRQNRVRPETPSEFFPDQQFRTMGHMSSTARSLRLMASRFMPMRIRR
jgi:hypothetical protein